MAPGLERCSEELCPMGSFIQDQATVYVSGSGWANRTFNKPVCFPMRNKQLLKTDQGILKVQNLFLLVPLSSLTTNSRMF